MANTRRPTSNTPGRYPLLAQVKDPIAQQIHKLVYDRLTGAEQSHAALASAVAAIQPGLTEAQVNALIRQALLPTSPTPLTGPAGPAPGGGAPSFLPCLLDLSDGQPASFPAPNKRFHRGNFCGVRVPGLPFVPQGPSDTTLVFTPFIDRYSPTDRQSIYTAYLRRGFTHFQISWINSRDTIGSGLDVAGFTALAAEIKAAGIPYVTVFVMGKGDDPNVANMAGTIDPMLNSLIASGVMDLCCVAWEASLWMDPTQTQAAIDHVCAITVPAGIPTYIHFQPNYTSFPQPNAFTASFWNDNIGKLSGLYFQADANADCGGRQQRIKEGLERFAGNDGYAVDCGFGHMWDFVTFEVTATNQFFAPNLSENDGNTIGFQELCTPAQHGPGGTNQVMGYMNGATIPPLGGLI